MRFSNGFQNALRQFVQLSAILFLASMFSLVSARNDRAQIPPGARLDEAQRLLTERGYWILKVDGKKNDSTYHAIIAFQKVEGRKRTGVLTQTELEAMRTASRPAAKSTGAAHIEIDITRQVIFLVDESGLVTHILPVSSGSDKKYLAAGKWETAHTPRGSFEVTRQIFGVRHAPLGNLYYPSYFFGGVAVHGSSSIPIFPASHGCVRIPNFAAREFQSLVTTGTPVTVYN